MSDWRIPGPATGAVVIDVSSADHTLTNVSRSVFVGGTGNLDVVMADGTTALIQTVVAGSVLPIAVKTFKQTTTTATKIVAFI